MLSSHQNPHLPAPLEHPSAPRPKRIKIDVACDACRTRKVKCDGTRPVCGSCSRKLDLQKTCRYSQSTIVQGQHQAPSHAHTPPGLHPATEGRARHRVSRAVDPARPELRRLTPRNDPSTGPSIATQSPAETLNSRSTEDHAARIRPDANANAISPSVIDSMTAVPDEGTSTREFFGSSSAGSFTAQIKRALDARLGRSGPPMAGYSNSQPASSGSAVRPELPSEATYVLPARRQADHLMNLYWLYVDPLYPFLDRPKWERSYHAVFAGTATEIEEHVFVATLNVIFALSIQLSESLSPNQRDEASSQFFSRAQDLLPLNIWHTGTVEQAQYLLLISQYLQSTDHPHQTWMVVGSAVRIAQGLGLHLPEASADRFNIDERELYRRIWHGCVLMDRVVAVTHGRPAMIPSHVAQRVTLPMSAPTPGQENPISILGNTITHASFFVKSVELYEIIYRTILAVYYSDGGPLPKCVANLHNRDLSSEDEDLAVVIQLDGALRKWKTTLPEHLKLLTPEARAMPVHRQAVILHIRFLHARILLLRPLLTRFCLSQSTDTQDQYDSLQARIVEQSASLCVDTAKSLVAVLLEYQTEDGTVGLLPAWWYRVYYVYTAAAVLIAANLRPQIFPASVLGTAWSQSMSVLKAHEKFGHSARRCVAALHMLSSKILQDNSTVSASRASSRADTGNLGVGHERIQPSAAASESNLLLQPVDEFPFAFEDFDQLQLADLDLDTNNLSWLNDMHAAWGMLNER